MPLILKTRTTVKDALGNVTARAYQFEMPDGSAYTYGIPTGNLGDALTSQRALAVAAARAAVQSKTIDSLNEVVDP